MVGLTASTAIGNGMCFIIAVFYFPVLGLIYYMFGSCISRNAFICKVVSTTCIAWGNPIWDGTIYACWSMIKKKKFLPGVSCILGLFSVVLTSKWIAVSILWSYERCWKQLLARWGTYKLKNLSSKALVQLWGNNSHWESYVFPWNTHASPKVTFLSTASKELFNVTEKNKYIISCYVCQISLIDWRTFYGVYERKWQTLWSTGVSSGVRSTVFFDVVHYQRRPHV